MISRSLFQRVSVSVISFKVTISPHLLEIPKGKEVKEDESHHHKHAEPEVKLGASDLFKNAFARKIILIMFVNWIVVTLG